MLEYLLNVISPAAYAETAGAPVPPPAQGESVSFLLMLAVFFVFIYFTVWRPQSKRAKEQQNLLGSLAKGDEVVIAGGMLGRITKITDQHIVLTISNNVDVVLQKSSVVTVLPKGTLKSIES